MKNLLIVSASRETFNGLLMNLIDAGSCWTNIVLKSEYLIRQFSADYPFLYFKIVII